MICHPSPRLAPATVNGFPGMASSNSRVYACLGARNTCSTGPFSTTKPPFITVTSSAIRRTTPRSWVTNRREGQPSGTRHDELRRVGQPRPRRRHQNHPPGPGRRRRCHRHRRRLLPGRERGDRRQSPRGRPPRQRTPRHQIPRPDRRQPPPPGQLTPLDPQSRRQQPAPTQHRPHRPLPSPPTRPLHRLRRNPRRADRSRPSGQDPLFRDLGPLPRADRGGAVDRRAAGLLRPLSSGAGTGRILWVGLRLRAGGASAGRSERRAAAEGGVGEGRWDGAGVPEVEDVPRRHDLVDPVEDVGAEPHVQAPR